MLQPRSALRFASTLVLAALLAAPVAAATSEAPLDISTAGSFLAGQQALEDMATAEAAKYLMAAAEADWDNLLLVDRAFFALAADGQVAEAARTAEHLLEIDPGNEIGTLVLGVQAMHEGRYDEAVEVLEALGVDNFTGISGAILRAWSLTGADRYDEAKALLDELGETGLDEFLAAPRAMMAEFAGDGDEAVRYARQALELSPYDSRAVEAFARISANAGGFDEALAAIEEYRIAGGSHPLVTDLEEPLKGQQPVDPFTRSVEAGAAMMFNIVGLPLADDRDRNGDGYPDGDPELGLVFIQLGNYLDPADPTGKLLLASFYSSAGQVERANALLGEIPEASPMWQMAVIRLAENLDTAGDREGAIARLQEIVDASPDNLVAVNSLGALLNDEKRYEESAELYSAALSTVDQDAPASWRFFFLRGIAYERSGEWAKAEPDFLKALELSPDQPSVLNYLGYSWVDMGINLDRALEMIEKAVAAQPTDGMIIDSLGWAYYRLGRIEEAVETLETAVQLMPSDPEINDHLGDAYWAAGREREARFQWRIAVSVDVDNRITPRASAKLAGEEPEIAAQ